MIVAVLAGLAAGALWALAFIAPELVRPFAASDLTLVRYAVFGASSLPLLAVLPGERWWPVVKVHWRAVVLLALAGNTFYYLLLSEAIQRSGPLLPAMVVGALPVVMTVLGGLRDGHFSPLRVAMPALFILSGLMTHIGTSPSPVPVTSASGSMLGLALAVAALASWAFYGLRNAELLDAHPCIDLLAWTALTGVATLITLVPLAAFSLGQGIGPWRSSFSEIAPLLFWGAVLGLLSSWLATWFWNIASRTLSGELLGYLIVSETVFAILYAFLLEWRLPTPAELLSMQLLITGVVLGMRATPRMRPQKQELARERIFSAQGRLDDDD
ncbi:DMT family transporter [Mesorhizobium abyssinicae]|uniref:DMT family transporter n=1 Tax=Mesorhizobium abyssinicae TaxID=1209958 RepID=UPI0033959A73